MFKDNLITLRKRAGLSQEQLANTLGISRQSVSKYELGTAEPDLARLAELKDLFHVTYDELLDQGSQHVSKSTTITNGLITIQSVVNGSVAQMSGFKIANTAGFGHKKAKAGLLGYSTTGSILGKDMYLLGYYVTKQVAEKELHAIQLAIQQGRATYELQYCLRNVKAGLLGLFTEI